MNVGFVTMEKYELRRPGSVGSSRIRGDWIIKYWDEAEHYQAGKKYDVMIFQKAYWEKMIKEFDGVKIFSLCDPDWLENRPVIEVARSVDAVVTSTEALAKQLRKFDIGDTIVEYMPDRVDFEWSKPVKQLHKGKLKSIVYFGYSHNAKKVLPAAEHAIKKRDLKLTIIADQPVRFSMIDADFIKYDEDTVNEDIIKHDAVILPEAPSTNYRFQFKSNNKTIQSWALGMPVVVTAKDLDKFETAEARNKERKRRLKEVKENWDVRYSVEDYKNLIERIKNAR